MPDQVPIRAPVLEVQRERTIKTLIEHFATDTLSVDELERRLDAAHRALELQQLDALTTDLPALPAETPAATAPAPASPRPVPSSVVRERQFEVAIMSAVEKKGQWTPARRTHVIAVMGGAEIDLREALLPAGVSEIQVFAIMGGADILVSPGTRVESNGISIMGAFEHVPEPATEDPNAPTVRITGFALMGAVEVHLRYPGESAREARVRRRAERKQLRVQQKRLRGEH